MELFPSAVRIAAPTAARRLRAQLERWGNGRSAMVFADDVVDAVAAADTPVKALPAVQVLRRRSMLSPGNSPARSWEGTFTASRCRRHISAAAGFWIGFWDFDGARHDQ
jgi:hypothetical protein